MKINNKKKEEMMAKTVRVRNTIWIEETDDLSAAVHARTERGVSFSAVGKSILAIWFDLLRYGRMSLLARFEAAELQLISKHLSGKVKLDEFHGSNQYFTSKLKMFATDSNRLDHKLRNLTIAEGFALIDVLEQSRIAKTDILTIITE